VPVSLRGRLDAVFSEDVGDGASANLMSQIGERAADSRVSPRAILERHAQNEIEVFSDRVAISSPGLTPAPITLANLRRGKYRPCSRNPVIAQCLSYFHRLEEWGSGSRRLRDQMFNHGLDQPLLGTDSGYFQVIFPGPGENLERLLAPTSIPGALVTPAPEAQLNQRQKKMVALLVRR
jgi:predicted HTH transcriptional regulator